MSDTVNLSHIKDHYFRSHGTINPTGIVPALDFTRPHRRDGLQTPPAAPSAA